MPRSTIKHFLYFLCLTFVSEVYADFPSYEKDNMMWAYRQKFSDARPIRESDMALLRLGHAWTCQGNYAISGLNYPGEEKFKSDLTFVYDHEYIRMRGGWHFQTAVFTERSGLHSLFIQNPGAEKNLDQLAYLYPIFRWSGKNEIVIEVSSSRAVGGTMPSIGLPGTSATEYYTCEATKNDDSEIESVSGFCKRNDDQVHTEEGG